MLPGMVVKQQAVPARVEALPLGMEETQQVEWSRSRPTIYKII